MTGATTPSPAQFTPRLVGNSVTVNEDGTGDYKDLESALNAIPKDAGNFTIEIQSDLYQSSRGFTLEVPTDKGLTSLTLTTTSGANVAVGQALYSSKNLLFANGVPLTVDAGVKFDGSLYGGSNGTDLIANTSVTLQPGGLIRNVYGGCLNATLQGSTSLVINGGFSEGISTGTGGTNLDWMPKLVVGGGHATISDARADVTKSTSVVLGKEGVAGKLYGGGYAVPLSSNSSCEATVTGDTTIDISGKTEYVTGGGCAKLDYYSLTKVSAIANVTGNTHISYAASAGGVLESEAMSVWGGGYAEGTTDLASSATAHVGGSTWISALDDEKAASSQKSSQAFHDLAGGGYAQNLNAQANVSGNTSVDTVRPAWEATVGIVGGGMASIGGTANVAGKTHVGIYKVPGTQIDKYENANHVVGGGFAANALISEPGVSALTTATTGETEVVVHAGARLTNGGTTSINVYGGGMARGNRCYADAQGLSSVVIEDNARVDRGVVGGGVVWKAADINTSSSANVGQTAISIGENAFIGGDTIGGGYILASYYATANTGSVTITIGKGATLNQRFAGAGSTNGSTSSTAIVEHDVNTFVDSSAKLNGLSSAGGGLVQGSTDSHADVAGNVMTSFADNVTTSTFVGAGMAYGSSKSSSANVAGSVTTAIGNGFKLTGGEFAGAGYVYYNTDSCEANVGTVSTTIGNDAQLKWIVGAGWVRQGNNDSANVSGTASLTIGENATTTGSPAIVGSGRAQESSGSRANVGMDPSADAVLVKIGRAKSIGIYYGGGYVNGPDTPVASYESSANVVGNVKTSMAGGTLGTFNGASCISKLANGHADIDGNIESTLEGFSFSATTQDYFARVVGAGAVLGCNAPATVTGNVTTRLKDCTINGNNDGKSTSFPYLGGRSNSNVQGDAELILDGTKVIKQNLFTKKGYMGAIRGTARLTMVGTVDVGNLYAYAARDGGSAELVVGEAERTTKGTIYGILGQGWGGNGPVDIRVLPQAELLLSNNFDDVAYHLTEVRNITIAESGKLTIPNSAFPAAIAGDLTGEGTILLPSGGAITGDGKLDGTLKLEVTGDLASGQTYFDFSDASTGDVAFTDPTGAFALTKDTSDAGRTKWVTQKQFSVTFDSQGGSEAAKQTVISGNLATKPIDPTKTGYNFKGWYANADFSGDAWDFEKDAVTADVTLYAKWAIQEFTVTLDLGDGSAPSTQTVAYDTQVAKPTPDPTREGYTFDGWFTDKDFTSTYDFAAKVTSDIDLFAKWTQVSQTATFEANGGSKVDPQTVFYGDKLTKPADPTKTGYTFDGWFSNKDLTVAWDFASDTIKNDLTLYAKWTAEKRTVTFDLGDGSAPTKQEVEYDTTISEPKQPVREGYTFDGWFISDDFSKRYDFATKITGDLTLFAKWTQITYTVSFEVNGDTKIDSQTIASGDLATKPNDPTKTGYDFKGWYANADFSGDTWDFEKDAVTADVTLYAKWTIQEFTVTFDLGDGSAPSTQTVAYDTQVVKPTPDPTREGYTFDGWFDEAGKQYDFTTPITDNITLSAQWSIENYTVTFEAQGGSPKPDAQTIAFGSKIAKPTDPTKDKFMFAGWYVNSDFSGSAWNFESDVITKDITLFAKWSDGIKVTVEAPTNGTITPNTEQMYTGTPLVYTFAPEYGYKIEKVTINGTETTFTPVDLRAGSITLSPTTETTLSVNFVELDKDTAEEIINELPTINPDVDPPEVVKEKTDTVLDAKLDYESMTPDEKKDLEQEFVDKLNEAVAKIPEVEVKVELAIDTEIGAEVAIPENQTSRFIGAVGKEEIEALKQGDATLLKVVVQIMNIDAPSTDEEEVLGGILGANKVGQHFAANVTKELSVGTTTLKTEPITLLPSPVELTFDVPQKLFDEIDKGTIREFALARTHLNGTQWEAQLLDDLDGNVTDAKITVSTDRFSTYSIVYSDTHTLTTHIVVFETDGGSPIEAQAVSEGALAKEPAAPTREGFMFAGWYTDGAFTNKYDFATQVTSDLTLHAKWIQLFEVTFDANGGTEVSSSTVPSGSLITAPATPKKDGFTFDGWFVDKELTKPWNFAVDVPTENITLYAKWLEVVDPQPDTFEVVFITGDGASKIETQRIEKGAHAIEPQVPTRDAYTFAGWFTNETFETRWNFDAPITAPLTLYAKWDKNTPEPIVTHVVTFNSNGGAPIPDAVEVVNGGFLVKPSVVPVLSGYTFAGWFRDAELTAAWNFDTDNVTADFTLYAKWTKNEIPVPDPDPEPGPDPDPEPTPDPDPAPRPDPAPGDDPDVTPGDEQSIKPLDTSAKATALAPTGDPLTGTVPFVLVLASIAVIAVARARTKRKG